MMCRMASESHIGHGTDSRCKTAPLSTSSGPYFGHIDRCSETALLAEGVETLPDTQLGDSWDFRQPRIRTEKRICGLGQSSARVCAIGVPLSWRSAEPHCPPDWMAFRIHLRRHYDAPFIGDRAGAGQWKAAMNRPT